MKTIEVRPLKGRNMIVFLLLLNIILFIGCSESIPGLSTDNKNIVNDLSSSMVVYPESGGTLSLPTLAGNGMLEIPPGALDQKTTITVSSLDEVDPNVIHLSLEPHGLTFNKPVRLTVSYKPEDDGSFPSLTLMQHVSELNDFVDAGSELLNWESLENTVIEEESHTITGEIKHFSDFFVLFGHQRVAYMIFDIPGKYLRPGDALFVLSVDKNNLRPNWVPGHMGMVRSVDKDLSELTVIESTRKGGPGGNVDGVQLNKFPLFKWGSGHVYMGARRPKGSIMNDDDRKKEIAYADLQEGKSYGVWGAPSSDGILGWACSMLVEACWDKADRGTTSWYNAWPTPVEMHEKTERVSDITVKVGEEVRIPVYPVIAHPDNWVDPTKKAYYDVGLEVEEIITVKGLPQNAKWEIDQFHPYKARTLIWTPGPIDAGQSHTVVFGLKGLYKTATPLDPDIPYDFTQPLNIHVQGAHKIIDVYPVQRGSSGNWIINLFPIPEGAIVSADSQDHLIDIETDNFPVNPIFENQILDNYYEGWSETSPEYYGSWKHLERLDDPYSDPPTGFRQWIYWIDYEVPLYNGLN